MGLLSIAKKTTPAAPTARDLLRTHLAAIAVVQGQRATIAERRSAMDRDIEAAGTTGADVTRLSESIDQQMGAARYAGDPLPDMSAQIAALNVARVRAENLGRIGRAAEIVRARVDGDLAKLTERLDALRRDQPRLLHTALVEAIEEDRGEFEAAKADLIAIHHRVFAKALAADKIAIANGFGQFQGSALFHDLNVTQPSTFEPSYRDAYEAGRALEAGHAAKRADALQLEKDSDALVLELLTK